MRIQHNILAANAYRNYKNNVSELKKDLEKLSSGHRIDRAADDAAGLAISEKMRAQITGLETAQKNAKDGISLVQTAEGALTEVHDMLGRMIELATQSANGTYESLDREQLQKELDQLRGEIDRIADGSNFNQIFLLNGSLDGEASVPYEMEFDVGGTLPDVGSREQIDTVLNQDATQGTKTSFEVDLKQALGDNIHFEPGDSVSISVKGVEIILRANDGTDGPTPTKADMDAAGLLHELLDTSENFSVIVKGTGYTATGLSKLVIDGQSFKLTGDGTKLKFEQESAPASASEVVAPPDEITIEGAGVQGTSKTVSVSPTASNDGSNGTRERYELELEISLDVLADPSAPLLFFGPSGTGTVTIGDLGGTVTNGIWTATCGNQTSGHVSITIEASSPGSYGVEPHTLDTTVLSSQMTTTAGTPATNAQYSLGLSGWTGGALTIKTSGGDKTIAWNTDAKTSIDNAAIDGYVLAYSNGTLTLTATNAGAVDTGNTGAGAAPAFSITGASYNVTSNTATVAVSDGAVTGTAGAPAKLASTNFDLDRKMLTDGSTLTIGGTTYTFTSEPAGPNDIDTSDRDLEAVARKLAQAAADNGTYRVHSVGKRIFLTEVQGQQNYDLSTVEGIESSLSFTGKPGEGKGLVLQIGDSSEEYDRLTVSIPDMHCDSLDIDKMDITTQENALDAISKIRTAINAVSNVRGGLGAIQNRLDHTISNLSVATENIQDAESTIRDTDVAEVLMTYTKNNILIQSAQTMLAQANQVPQGVLNLLQ